jgi:putative flavoprotein involved in K+ transport
MHRWDEFRLVTPNWTASFPGWEYDGTDPDGFTTRDEVVARVAQYAHVVGAPVALATEILRLAPASGDRFRATTNRGELTAREVVVATRSYHALTSDGPQSRDL